MSTNNSSYRPPAKPPVNPKTGAYAYKPPTQSNHAPTHSTSKKCRGGCLSILLKLILLIFVVTIIGNWIDSGKLSMPDSFSDLFDRGPSDAEMVDLTASQAAFQTIEEKYLVDGYVPTEQTAACTAEITRHADRLMDRGVLEEYSQEGDTVWMLYTTGLQSIYVPPTEDTLSFSTGDAYSIMTLEPHAGTFAPQYDPYVNKNSEAAVLLDNVSDQWSYTYAGKSQSVTPATVQTFGEHQIILWLGHGAWTSKNGACLITGEFFDSDRYDSDKDYRKLFTDGYLVCTGSEPSRVVITPKYIDAYAGSMEDSVIFLGACSSGKGVELVRAFLNKGAQAVVANSDEIRIVYYTSMMRTMVEALCSQDASGQYNTFSAALEIARQQHGYDDRNYPKGLGAKVEIFGPDVRNLRITDVFQTDVPEAAPETAPTPNAEPTPEPVTVDTYETLANYAAQFGYLNGTSGYTGAYTKTELRNIYSYDVPIAPVAYTIADFDGDGTDELLIVDTNSDHSVHLEMYEANGNSVSCTAETDLSVPIAGSTENSLTEYFYFPRNNRLQICVSEFAVAERVATGTILRCAGAVYDGSSFTNLGKAEIIGTAGPDDPFVSDMAALGFSNIDLYDMLYGYTTAKDYLQSCTVFCTARAMCTITEGEWMTYQDAWILDDSLTRLEISHIGFKRDLLG